MDNRTQINALQHCKTWLIHNEYSPATIEKYTYASVHFLADTAAKITTPAPSARSFSTTLPEF